jgi:hypothetical protein
LLIGRPGHVTSKLLGWLFESTEYRHAETSQYAS